MAAIFRRHEGEWPDLKRTYGLKASILHHMDIHNRLLECPHNMAPGHPTELVIHDRKRDVSCNVLFYDPPLETTYFFS